MIRIHNMLLAAALASAIALPCTAESLSLADLADAQDAQMIDMDAQDGAWIYPIPYDLLMTSDYIVLANKESLLDETYVPQDLVKLTCRRSAPIRSRCARLPRRHSQTCSTRRRRTVLRSTPIPVIAVIARKRPCILTA